MPALEGKITSFGLSQKLNNISFLAFPLKIILGMLSCTMDIYLNKLNNSKLPKLLHSREIQFRHPLLVHSHGVPAKLQYFSSRDLEQLHLIKVGIVQLWH